jgi:hypothetical protein
MFAAIGVTLDWRRGFSGCPSQAIMISLTDNTPTSLQPGALAYALPYRSGIVLRLPSMDRMLRLFRKNFKRPFSRSARCPAAAFLCSSCSISAFAGS